MLISLSATCLRCARRGEFVSRRPRKILLSRWMVARYNSAVFSHSIIVASMLTSANHFGTRLFGEFRPAWLEFSRALVVNRASPGAPNINKFLHAVELRNCGFRTPEQMIIGNNSCAESVLDPSGAWISKSCSGSRTIAIAPRTLRFSVGYVTSKSHPPTQQPRWILFPSPI
jgi:hypothetical protein